MYYARNSPREDGYRHFEWYWIVTVFLHTLLLLSNKVKVLKWSSQTFPMRPIHIYNAFKLDVIYSMHSGDDIH